MGGRAAAGAQGRWGEGETKIEGWSRESRGSDVTSDAETEEDGGVHALLTASPWGMQESGERGLWGDARDGGSDGRKGPSTTADEGETRGRHGTRREQGEKKGGWWGWEGAQPLGVGGNYGDHEASRVDPKPHRVE